MNISFWSNFRNKFVEYYLFETGPKSKNSALKIFNWLKTFLPSDKAYIKEDTTRYVLGFLFSEDLERVVLITKTKPEWQAGSLNGIGGKVENYDETFQHAMSREFKEEAGILIKPDKWKYFAEILDFKMEFYVSCYYTIGDVDKVTSMEGEQVGIYYVDKLRNYKTIRNIQWLIPLALDGEANVSAYYNIKNLE